MSFCSIYYEKSRKRRTLIALVPSATFIRKFIFNLLNNPIS